MVLIVAVATLIFLIVAFISIPPLTISNSLIGYSYVQFQFIKENLVIFISGLLIVTTIFVLVKSFDKNHNFIKRLQLSILYIFQVSFLGFLLAFVLLFAIALIELNIVAILINLNPKFLGIVSDITTIQKSLKANNQNIEIVPGQEAVGKELSTITKVFSGTNNFYGKYILSSIPTYLTLPIGKFDTDTLLIDNTLIVQKINKNDMQLISPVIGHIFLQNYFWGRKIKSYPRLNIMNNNEYSKFRLADANKKSLLVNSDLRKMENSISSISASLIIDEKTIEENKDLITQVYIDKNTQYSKCMTSGKKVSGKFVNNYTQSECRSSVVELEEKIDQANRDIASLTKKIKSDKKLLASYQYIKAFYDSQSQLVNASTLNIPHELGVFIPGDTIKIVVNVKSTSTIVDYFETFIHEYLHYASYNKGKTFKDTFFEEGLTEYFARNIINSQLHSSTNLAYPVQVKIIEELFKVIPEDELEDIYFTKDQTKLESTLDRVYGPDFYRTNIALFDTLQYSSDKSQTLKLANEIMKLVEGKKFTEKDLFSTPSSL